MRRVKIEDIYTITPTITTNPIIYTDTNTIIITRIQLSKTHKRPLGYLERSYPGG